MSEGKFITLEGPDGSGKTTLANALCTTLEERGYSLVHTREPGGIRIAEDIRDIILNPANTMMDAKTEALLYAASRSQHLSEKVIPALKEGKIVICERFIDSSLAYQGYGRALGFEEVYSINRFAVGEHMPDLTIFLDVDEKVGLARIADRDQKDRLDRESLAFHHRVKEGYQEVIRRFPERIRIVDASLSFEAVLDQSLSLILKVIDD